MPISALFTFVSSVAFASLIWETGNEEFAPFDLLPGDAMSDPRRKVGAVIPTEPPKEGGTTEAPRRQGRVEITLDGVRVEVSPELEAAVHRAYKGLCQPLPAEMTTTQAAEFLDVSRPFVIKLIQRRELPCRMVGKHRRIPTEALLAYREQMFQRAKTAADEMADRSQELGLYDAGGPRKTSGC